MQSFSANKKAHPNPIRRKRFGVLVATWGSLLKILVVGASGRPYEGDSSLSH